MAGSRWQSVAALVDPVRRALYEYVRRQRRAVTREEAAEAQSISRSLTAFHLDKLVDTGLLRARYERPADQRRGRGRAPKVYEAAGDIAVTVPPRRYDLAGEILADAVASTGGAAVEAARAQAYARGRAAGSGRDAVSGHAAGSGRDAGGAADLAAAGAALADLGFEPCSGAAGAGAAAGPTTGSDAGSAAGSHAGPAAGSAAGSAVGLLLANCPFHALAQRQRALVCGINHAFVRGVLAGLGTERLAARLAPRPGMCCVEVVPAP